MDKPVHDDLVAKIKNLCRDFLHEHGVEVIIIVNEDHGIRLIEGTAGKGLMPPLEPGEWTFITPDGERVTAPGVPVHRGLAAGGMIDQTSSYPIGEDHPSDQIAPRKSRTLK